MMEHHLRAALLGWLQSDPALADRLNAIEEETPVAASAPWLGIAASASIDWSVKERTGREVRLALELHDRTDDAEATAATISLIERRVATFMPTGEPFVLVACAFLRSRAERRPNNVRATLLEYRFRMFAKP